MQHGTVVRLARPEYVDQHPGGGDDVFGQLTARGLEQMRQRGEECRLELLKAGGAPAVALECGDVKRIAVTCTEFNRTLLSVQSFLHGLVLDHSPPPTAEIVIGTRGTDLLLPDPEPRWPGQAAAEAAVWNSEEVLVREASMAGLRERIASILESEDLLGPPPAKPSTAGAPQPSWGRLAEILKCLHSYDRLPPSISPEDVDVVVGHGAWRWFTMLSSKHGVVDTASAPIGRALIDACTEAITKSDHSSNTAAGGSDSTPAIRIYSCHDSTLIGIMQTLGLHSEAWPAYASVLQLQLLHSQETDVSFAANPSRYYLRATLNGETLTWLGQSHNCVATEDGVVVPFEAVRDALSATFPAATGAFGEFWQSSSEQLALPAGVVGEDRPQVQVGGGSTSLESLGPVVVNKDGSLARIANWQQMTEEEKAAAKRLIGAQNKKRMAALRNI